MNGHVKNTLTILVAAVVLQACGSAKVKPEPVESSPPVQAAPAVTAVVPVDSDGDGVMDEDDACANTRPGVRVDASGCEVMLSLGGPLFEFDRSELTPAAIAILDQAVAKLIENPAKNVEVAGHTCAIGTEGYNYGLSVRRAHSVRDYLLSHNISASRMKIVYYGELRPIADNNTKQGRELNRRVELVDLSS